VLKKKWRIVDLETLESFWRNYPETHVGLAALGLGLVCLVFFAAMNRGRDRSRDISARIIWPWVLVVGGVVLAGYFFLFFDTSISTPGGALIGIDRVNNFGLLNQRQNGIIIGIGMALLGAVFLAINSRSVK
jgi:drug/metabolite transporter (DMT)-like permease